MKRYRKVEKEVDEDEIQTKRDEFEALYKDDIDVLDELEAKLNKNDFIDDGNEIIE